jgi:methionyl-tRNA formyltransferase
LRIAFAGSPGVAIPVLRALVESRHEVGLVITQPEKPRGRGGAVRPTPIGALAAELGLLLLAPRSINLPEAMDALRKARVGALCVAAFGQLLKKPVLDEWPCLNVHYSLLPAYRGAAPLERAIMEGNAETGVTIMRMDEGLDTGPMIASVRVPIAPDDDFGAVSDSLAVHGGRLLVAALDDLEAGKLVEMPQPEVGVSLAPKLTAADRAFDPTLDAQSLVDRIRGLSPHIGVAAVIDDLRFKLWRATARPDATVEGLVRDEGRLLAGCTNGAIEIVELQPPGKGRMSAEAFLRGYRGPLALGVLPDPAT